MDLARFLQDYSQKFPEHLRETKENLLKEMSSNIEGAFLDAYRVGMLDAKNVRYPRAVEWSKGYFKSFFDIILPGRDPVFVRATQAFTLPKHKEWTRYLQMSYLKGFNDYHKGIYDEERFKREIA